MPLQRRDIRSKPGVLSGEIDLTGRKHWMIGRQV
jgi:hypothetical protein